MLEEKITEALGKVMELGERFGTPAFDAVVRGVQLEGVIALVIGGAVALLIPVAVWGVVKALQSRGDDGALLFTVSAVVLVITSATAAVQLLIPSHWIAALDPVAEIARRLVAGG